jgi:hypothetical protein
MFSGTAVFRNKQANATDEAEGEKVLEHKRDGIKMGTRVCVWNNESVT